jgi:hypothetical protein
MAAVGELGGDPQLDGAEAKLGEPFGLGFDQQRSPHVGQRAAVPQGQCLGKFARRG